MLRNLKQMQGRSLRARDGNVGEVKDVYFDDQSWTVRYLVVATGSWLKDRDVLIAPRALQPLSDQPDIVPVDLTIEQVRSSPPVDTRQPVSRQHEEALHQHYGWPVYWSPGPTTSPLPIPPATTSETVTTGVDAPVVRQTDPSLRSARETLGYHIEANDGKIGHVEEFLFDDVAWVVRYLVVDTRNWLPGKKVIVAPQWIDAVDWARKSVVVSLSRASIKESPAYDPSAPWDPTYGTLLEGHYRQNRGAGVPPRVE